MKEKDFLYLYAHKAIQTNGIKSKYGYEGDKVVSSDCRRCLHENPGGEPAFESRGHAFHECPTVLALWIQVLSWLQKLCPGLALSDDANQLLLAWPETDDLPEIALHIHSAATHAIWRTYCKLGDKEKLYRDQLITMTVFAIKERAKVELARAQYRDQERHNKATTGVEWRVLAVEPDMFYNKMKEEWHHPPHISVAKTGVTFGGMWDLSEEETEPAEE